MEIRYYGTMGWLLSTGINVIIYHNGVLTTGMLVMGDEAGLSCDLAWVEYILGWIVILLSLGPLSGGGGCITK